MSQAGDDDIPAGAGTSGDGGQGGSGREPGAGLDDVARAKRRLLELDDAEGGDGDGERSPRFAARMAVVAFVAGFFMARQRRLRRALLRGGYRTAKWLIRHVLHGSKRRRA